MEYNYDNIVEESIKLFYEGGKGKDCEICRMRGLKRLAYTYRKLEDGLEYYLCWDCAGALWERQQKEKQNGI
jgi:hypothetical protein